MAIWKQRQISVSLCVSIQFSIGREKVQIWKLNKTDSGPNPWVMRRHNVNGVVSSWVDVHVNN